MGLRQKIVEVASCLLVGFMKGPLMASEPEYSKIIQAIAQDIEGIKAEFPQLKLFSSSSPVCVYHEGLRISYGYKTHHPRRRAGWTGGVPEPDADGIWFYIGIYDRNSPS